MTVALPTEGRHITLYPIHPLWQPTGRMSEMCLLSQYSALSNPNSAIGLRSHSDLF
jgi:hypothetical protein